MGSSAGKTNRRRTPKNLGHDSLPLAGGAERYETIQFATRRFAGGAERYEPREGPSRERSSAGTRGGEPRETTCTTSNPDAPRGGRTPSLVRAAPMQFFSGRWGEEAAAAGRGRVWCFFYFTRGNCGSNAGRGPCGYAAAGAKGYALKRGSLEAEPFDRVEVR